LKKLLRKKIRFRKGKVKKTPFQDKITKSYINKAGLKGMAQTGLLPSELLYWV